MSSIFTKIIKGEIHFFKIAETEDYFAFLDINPQAKGHTLCVPKQETDYIFDLEDDVLSGLSIFSKKVAKAIETVVDCQRVGVLVVGTEVPHAHVHLIPFQTERQMSASSKIIKMENEEMQKLAAAISANF